MGIASARQEQTACLTRISSRALLCARLTLRQRTTKGKCHERALDLGHPLHHRHRAGGDPRRYPGRDGAFQDHAIRQDRPERRPPRAVPRIRRRAAGFLAARAESRAAPRRQGRALGARQERAPAAGDPDCGCFGTRRDAASAGAVDEPGLDPGLQLALHRYHHPERGVAAGGAPYGLGVPCAAVRLGEGVPALALRFLNSYTIRATPSAAPATLTASIRLEAWCGESSITPAAAKAMRIAGGSRRVKYPTIAAQINQMPNSELSVTTAMSQMPPFIRIAGE